MSTIAERVAKGVALLDERRPSWWKADAARPVSLELLDIDSCERCVLGQAFDSGRGHDEGHCDYEAALDDLGGPCDRDYGFDGSVAECDDLTAEWKRVIEQRRAGAA